MHIPERLMNLGQHCLLILQKTRYMTEWIKTAIKKKISMNKMLVECAHVENGVRD